MGYQLPEKRYSFDFADVELLENQILVDSQVKSKHLEKNYGDLLDNMSNEASDLIKNIFQKNKENEESINQEIRMELFGFFEQVARQEGVEGEVLAATGSPSPAAAAPASVASSDSLSDDDVYDESSAADEYNEEEEIPSNYVVQVVETMNLESNRDEEITESMVKGQINVKNEGDRDLIWDIDIRLADSEKTDLESTELHIPELNPKDIWTAEYNVEVPEEVSSLLKVEETIDTRPEKEEKSEVYILDPESEGQQTTLKLVAENTSDTALQNIKIKKHVPDDFQELEITSKSTGECTQEEGSIIWEVDEMDAGASMELDISFKVYPTEIKTISSGVITVEYSLNDGSYSGLNPEFIDGLSNQIYFVDRDEREEEPDVWDCEFVFRNRSEFPMLLQKLEISSGDEDTEYEMIAQEPNVLIQPAGNWKSEAWDLESEDEPAFSETILYTVLPRVERSLAVNKIIKPYDLMIISIVGEKIFSTYELQSYRDATVDVTLSIHTQGDTLADKIQLDDTIPADFQCPEKESVSITIGETTIEDFTIVQEPEGDDLSIERKMVVEIDNYYDTYGELPDGTEINITYPLDAVKPPKDMTYEAPATFRLITHPSGKPLEVLMEPEALVVMHRRRGTRVGKSIMPKAEKDVYEILLLYRNKGDAIKNDIKIADFLPGEFSILESPMEYEATNQDDGQLLTWTIPEIQPGEEIEIIYTVQGEGDSYSLKSVETKAFK
jgi:hypothetical protein